MSLHTDRTSHPSRSQVEYLLDFLEKNPSLAKGFPKFSSARDKARNAWAKLAVQLNSLRGCAKSWKQWTKYWADKKSAVRKKAALRCQASNKAGENVVDLNDIEERILTLIRGQNLPVGDSGDSKHNILRISTAIDDDSSPRECKRSLSPPSEQESSFSRMTDRLLRLEEQRIEVEQRNSQIFEALVNHEVERDRTNNQALLAIGEGLKLLAEAIKLNK